MIMHYINRIRFRIIANKVARMCKKHSLATACDWILDKASTVKSKELKELLNDYEYALKTFGGNNEKEAYRICNDATSADGCDKRS